jgi:hypothetical protein
MTHKRFRKCQSEHILGRTEPLKMLRRGWRYQRGNQNPYIEEGQTTQWLKEKEQKDKQRSTKHTHKTKGELKCPGRINSACSTSGTHRFNLVKDSQVIMNDFHVTGAHKKKPIYKPDINTAVRYWILLIFHLLSCTTKFWWTGKSQ